MTRQYATRIMLAVAIIALLTAIAVPNFIKAREQQRYNKYAPVDCGYCPLCGKKK